MRDPRPRPGATTWECDSRQWIAGLSAVSAVPKKDQSGETAIRPGFVSSQNRANRGILRNLWPVIASGMPRRGGDMAPGPSRIRDPTDMLSEHVPSVTSTTGTHGPGTLGEALQVGLTRPAPRSLPGTTTPEGSRITAMPRAVTSSSWRPTAKAPWRSLALSSISI